MKQAVQRFENLGDLDLQEVTIEEREEYEQHIKKGTVVSTSGSTASRAPPGEAGCGLSSSTCFLMCVRSYVTCLLPTQVYAGVDYERILRQAEAEADVVIWDGGNNDTPFYAPDLWVCVADPHRAGHEELYYPGDLNFRMADGEEAALPWLVLPRTVLPWGRERFGQWWDGLLRLLPWLPACCLPAWAACLGLGGEPGLGRLGGNGATPPGPAPSSFRRGGRTGRTDTMHPPAAVQ